MIAAVVCLGVDPASSEPVRRQYRIREDSDTGRLVRVAVRVRNSPSSDAAEASGSAASGAKKVVQGRSAGSVDLETLVRRAAEQHGVDPALIFAVIRQESAFDPYAVSRKGAVGLMQLMPETAKVLGVKDILDPAENVHGGVKYLRRLLERYEGDVRLALAAYNAGEGAVDRYGEIPPYRETRDYVERISSWYPTGEKAVADGEEVVEASTSRIAFVQAADGSLRFETARSEPVRFETASDD